MVMRRSSSGRGGAKPGGDTFGDGFRPGLLGDGKVEGLLRPQDFPGLAKELVHPGKSTAELLMRTVFDSDEKAVAAARHLGKLKEFGLEREKEEFAYLLSANCSIRGRSTVLLLQALTGIIAPQLLNGHKKRKGRGREDEE